MVSSVRDGVKRLTCVCGPRMLSDNIKDQLLVTIQKAFNYSRLQAQQIVLMVMECMKKKSLVGPCCGGLGRLLFRSRRTNKRHAGEH